MLVCITEECHVKYSFGGLDDDITMNEMERVICVYAMT